jgi:hypothetical protein
VTRDGFFPGERKASVLNSFTKEGTLATTASDKSSVSAEEALKRQKKQARREARLMLAIEAAKKDLKKAQKQQSKAQGRLEEQSTALHTLEVRLEELRAPGPETAIETSPPIAELEQQPAHTEPESSSTRADEAVQALSDSEHHGTLSSLTAQILAAPPVEEGSRAASSSSETEPSPAPEAAPTPLTDAEATSPEATVVTQDAAAEEAMQEHQDAVEHAPTPITPRERSAPKTTPAPRRPVRRSQQTRKPAPDAGHEG